MLNDTIKSDFEKNPPSAMLDATITAQLKEHFEKLRYPVEMVISLDDSSKAHDMSVLLREIAELSEKISVRNDGNDMRRPSFSVARLGDPVRIRFAGIPMGHELTSLVMALLHTGGHPPKVDEELIETIRSLPGPFHFETYVTLSCKNCPDAVQALNLMAVLNPGISHTMIDGSLFKNEIEQHGIDTVPRIHLNGERFAQGRKTLEELVAKLVTPTEY